MSATPASASKVNGRIVPLKTALKNGDVVEILTQAGHLPSKDWLAIVKTSRARNKIKHVINATERERAIDIGQKYLERKPGVWACDEPHSTNDLEALPPTTALARSKICTPR